MVNCTVCCEKLNKINHKKVECPFCDLTNCRTCCQKYILSTFDDPHCMGCKNIWNREFIDSFCSQSFRNNELRRHRENVLFEREKARMPETQPEVERILKIRKLRVLLQSQKEKLIELHHKYKTFDTPCDKIHPDIRRLYREIEIIYRDLEHLRNGGTLITDGEPRKFIRQCPIEECKGFLNEDWFCGLCDSNYCKDCNEKLSDGHTCDPELAKTMKLLNNDSKSCPKCGTVIHKTSGCAQMWCVSCHTAFNWRTGEIEMGRIHNPHFIEFRNKSMNSREHGDIPCGGTPSFRELRTIGASEHILQYSMIIHQLETQNLFMDVRPVDNLHYRIAYMLNDINELTFKTFLQRQEKFKEKTRDIFNIFEMITHTSGDLLRQYILEPWRHDEIIVQLQKIIEYGNDIFDVIRKRYKCVAPRNINV